jgi:hypothetical protein
MYKWVASLRRLTSPRLLALRRQHQSTQSSRAQVVRKAPLMLVVLCLLLQRLPRVKNLPAQNRLKPARLCRQVRTFGLGTIGGPSLAGESSVPQAGKSLWWYAQVEESLTKDPEFIKAGFNIGRFVTTAVDTKKDCTNMDAL